MYVVTGVTGRTGAVAAQALLDAGESVRVVIRDKTQGGRWATMGAEVAVADLSDKQALTEAFSGAQGAYLVSPPGYHLPDMFEQAKTTANSLAEAISAARLPKLVLLSSVGADQPSGAGIIATNRMTEQRLRQLDIPLTFLRAGYFMENWGRVIESVLAQGILPSFLAPLDRAIPMVATMDIGRVAAQALLEHWTGVRTIALEGPIAYSPNDIARLLAQALQRPVRAVAVEESAWADVLAQSGFSAPAVAGFIEMNQALNSGHITFDSDTHVNRKKGTIPFEHIAASLAYQG